MTLDILVPQFREDDAVARYLLDSIRMQQGINFSDVKVIICNDGSDVLLSDDLINDYPYKIEYYKCDHAGVSATRNKCLEKSNADLVMFCDIDDGFYSNLGIWTIFKVFEKRPDTDVYVTTFIEELEVDGRMTYTDHEPSDKVFVHGKVFRRQYLTDNNIKFNAALTVHEDSFFNKLAQLCTDNVFRSDASFYIWRYRKESVCRREDRDMYLIHTFGNMIDTETELTKELLARDKRTEAAELAASVMWMAYYSMNTARWCAPARASDKHHALKRIARYWKTYRKLFEECPFEKRMAISQNARANAIKDGLITETIGFGIWIKTLTDMK